MSIRVWPPAKWCAEINPEQTNICDQPRGHEGDHSGPEMPTVEINESARLHCECHGGPHGGYTCDYCRGAAEVTS